MQRNDRSRNLLAGFFVVIIIVVVLFVLEGLISGWRLY
jgi:hypothetical protein